jgi:hypothetical protein
MQRTISRLVLPSGLLPDRKARPCLWLIMKVESPPTVAERF